MSLYWIAEEYAARLDQLQRVLGHQIDCDAKDEHGMSENATRLIVNRWKRAHLVEYRKFTAEDPGWVWLTAHGMWQLGLPYKAYEPSLSKLEHRFMVNEVRLMLEEELPNGSWLCKRDVRAVVSSIKGHAPSHLPDAEFVTKEGTIAIEVELSAKKPAELQRVLQELTAIYSQVWYYVTDATRNSLLAAKERLDPVTANSIVVWMHPQWEEDKEEEEEQA
jgi:hypothetical protein